VQERIPSAGSISPEQLGTLSTLRLIAQALSAPGSSAAVARSAVAASGPVLGTDKSHCSIELPAKKHQEDRLIASANGAPKPRPTDLRLLYPAPLLLRNQVERELIQIPAGATVWLTGDGSPLTDALCGALKKHDLRCQVIRLDQETIQPPDHTFCGLIILAPREPHEPTFVKDAFRVLRAAGPALQRAAARGCAVLVTVSRFDGTFGLNGLALESSPAAGALAGLAKTARHEWQGVDCKALDLDRSIESPQEAADAIVDEIVRKGPGEVGLKSDNTRVCIELEPASSWGSHNGVHNGRFVPLRRDDLVVMSGGARGVTAEVAVALAKSFGPRLVLLGRTPAPAAEPDWMADIRDDAQLKRVLLDRSNGRRSPHELGEETRRLLTEREIRRNLTRIEEAGSQVIYRSIDVRDGAAVRAILQEMQAKYGKIRGLIHGAGVVADRKIIDQTDAQFDAIYDTKVLGLDHLFQAIDPQALSFLILFSSSTARFGRTGQVAYAAANEVLNKWAQQQSLRLPHCRVISYNWGPWAGGMVQDSLKPLFEKEGIALIPLEAGARCVVDQIKKGSPTAVEVVVLAEHNPTASVTATPTPKSTATLPAERKPEPVFRRAVDLESLPVIASHVIDGHPVLPMAIMLEWLAEGAIHRNPGLVVSGIDDLRLFKGVILNHSPQASVEVCVGKAVRHGSQFVVPTELKGIMAGGREIAHARADVILTDRHATGARKLAETTLIPYPHTCAEIYRTILFHGPALQGIDKVEGLGDHAVSGWAATAPEPAEWLDRPLRSAWLTDPLAIDCAFQLVVLWCRNRLGANSLPTAIGGYRQYRRSFPAAGVRIQAEIQHSSDTRVVADIEFLDGHGDLVARLESYECVVDASLNQAFRRNQIAQAMTFPPLVKGAPGGVVRALSDTSQPKY
jgi:NAD(P)-dependent dehydrogenase (short-subunit alcohol dehydrogenase family)